MESSNLIAEIFFPPHSLGKLIEWKVLVEKFTFSILFDLPTRWGN
jgi:hypothetical protein